MSPSEEKLSFGIMANDLEFSDWMARSIKKLMRMDNVNLELIILDGREYSGYRHLDAYEFPDYPLIPDGIRKNLSKYIEYGMRTNPKEAIDYANWAYYRRFTNTSTGSIKASRTRDLSDEFSPVDKISVIVEEQGFSEYFQPGDIDVIRDYDLDFILRAGFEIIRGEILEVPKYGIWSFHHADEREYRGGPAGLWEVIKGDPISGAILQRLTDRLDGGIVLKRGHFRTQENWPKNLNHTLYGTVEWPSQVAIDLLNGEADYLTDDPSKTNAPIYRNPSLFELCVKHIRDIRDSGEEFIRGMPIWNIGIVDADIPGVLNEQDGSNVNWFPHRRSDAFIADPFPIEIGGKDYIFVEDFSYSAGKGKISYIEYPDGFKRGEIKTAHEEPIHMSYPFVFESDGIIYATPETYNANEVRLYEVHAPDQWELKTSLISGVAAVDPTVINHNGKWWLFFTRCDELINNEDYEQEKLFVYSSDELTGEWTPHQNNPVKTDIRSVRPGGTPIEVDGKLFRPAQYSTEYYGMKVAINQIQELTTTKYEEDVVSYITPKEPYIDGTHTLSSGGGYIIIDGKKYMRNHRWQKQTLKQLGSKVLPQRLKDIIKQNTEIGGGAE
jgi:hypothetical protein